MATRQPIFPIQNFVVTPYKGTLSGVNISLLTTGGGVTAAGQVISQGKQSKTVTTIFDWLNDYPGQGASVNLQSQGTAPPLDKLLMVFVDNETNSQQITIFFPDTQQFVSVPPFTTGYYPVLTGNQFCNVYNGDTGKVPITAVSQTQIIFCNFAVPGFLSEQSISVTVNSSGGLIIPSIGDLVDDNNISFTSFNPEVILLPAVALPQQYVITAILVASVGLYIDTPITLTPPTTYQPYVFALTDDVTFLDIRSWILNVGMNMDNYNYKIISEETGLNIPVQQLTMQLHGNEINAGQIMVNIAYALVTR